MQGDPVHTGVLQPLAQVQIDILALVEAQAELDAHPASVWMLGGLANHDRGQLHQFVQVLHELHAGAGFEHLAHRTARVEVEMAESHG